MPSSASATSVSDYPPPKRSRSREGRKGKTDKSDKSGNKEVVRMLGDFLGQFSSFQTQITTQVSTVSSQVGTLQASVGSVEKSVVTLEKNFSDFKTDATNNINAIRIELATHSKQIEDLRQHPTPVELTQAGGDSSKFGAGGNSSRPPIKPEFVPKGKRRCIVVRGFPYDTLSSDIVDETRKLFEPFKQHVPDISSPGKL